MSNITKKLCGVVVLAATPFVYAGGSKYFAESPYIISLMLFLAAIVGFKIGFDLLFGMPATRS